MSGIENIEFIYPGENFILNKDFETYKNTILTFCREYTSDKQTFTMQTSGSTGAPKSIEVNRNQLEASVKMTAAALGLQAGDRALVCLNTSLIAGTMMLVRSLELKMKMTVIPPVSDPFNFLPEGAVFDFTAMVPYQLQNILEQSASKISILNTMKGILIGGAPVSQRLEENLQQISAPIWHTYGMTETVSHIALRKLNGTGRTNYFKALPGITLGLDERNCLTISGAVTNFKELITNDVVDLISPDSFLWLGRADNIINSGGVKILPESIEKKLDPIVRSLNVTAKFFIAGIEDSSFGTIAVLFVEGKKNELLNQQLEAELKKVLTKYEIPRKIFWIEKFAETSSGKTDRNGTIKLAGIN